jgi:hypothetical protein
VSTEQQAQRITHRPLHLRLLSTEFGPLTGPGLGERRGFAKGDR